MVPGLYYGMGFAVSCVGGALGLREIHKLSSNSSPLNEKAIKAITLGGGALCLTLQTVSLLMHESSPFWKGFSTPVPILCLFTGKVIGRTMTQNYLAGKELNIVVSKQFHEEMATSTWKDAALASSLFLVSRISSCVATTFAPYLGMVLGMVQVNCAAERTREITKKSQ